MAHKWLIAESYYSFAQDPPVPVSPGPAARARRSAHRQEPSASFFQPAACQERAGLWTARSEPQANGAEQPIVNV